MSVRVRVLLVVLTLLVAGASWARWWMEGSPKKFWRPDSNQPQNRHEYCPDGLDFQILFFSEMLRGTEGAREAYVGWIREHNAHQSSTYLVEVSAAPFVLAGMEPVHAFLCVSALATIGALFVLAHWMRVALGAPAAFRACAMVLILVHPSTLRCFCRPQTDGLLALFVALALYASWRLPRRPTLWACALLALAGTAGCFVKIHAVALLAVPTALAFTGGARGADLRRTLLWSAVIPVFGWCLVFLAADLFPTIAAAWRTKETFYGDWTWAGRSTRLGLLALPLLVPLVVPTTRDRTRDGLLFLVGGYAALLVATGLPPMARFLYPIVGVTAAWAVARAACWSARPRRLWWGAAVALFVAVDLAVLWVDVHGRYWGPTRDLAPLDWWVYMLL